MSDHPTRTEEADGEVPGAQALLRGLDLLLAIGAAPEPLRFRDLEASVSIPRATLHRLLSALVSRGLVRQDERTRTYQLGARVLELSRRALDKSAVIRAAKPELARLARHLRRTVCVSVLEGEEVFVLDFEDADAAYGRLFRVWPRTRALESAAGRALLAAMPRERSDAYLTGLANRPSAAVLERLRTELAASKALGYAVMSREGATDRAGAAAAIVDATGYPTAALTCLFEADQVAAEDLHDAGRLLKEAAKRASGHIGMGRATPDILPQPPRQPGPEVEILPTGRDFVGENPVWNARRQRLYWVDVLAPALRWWDPGSRETGRMELPRLTAGIAFDGQDRLVAAGQHGLFLLDPDSGASRPLLDPEEDRPDNRFNTVGVDPRGRLWAGTMAVNHEVGRGSLYSVEPDLTVHRRLDRVGLPRNIALDADGRLLFFADAAEGAVLVFDCDPASGNIANRRVFLRPEDMAGVPNGIAMDAEGHLWVACLGGWRVCRFDPDGRLAAEIPLPVPMPTNCAFGGEDLSTLYVTSTWIRLPAGMSARAPASGQLIAIRTGIRGQTPSRFQQGR